MAITKLDWWGCSTGAMKFCWKQHPGFLKNEPTLPKGHPHKKRFVGGLVFLTDNRLHKTSRLPLTEGPPAVKPWAFFWTEYETPHFKVAFEHDYYENLCPVHGVAVRLGDMKGITVDLKKGKPFITGIPSRSERQGLFWISTHVREVYSILRKGSGENTSASTRPEVQCAPETLKDLESKKSPRHKKGLPPPDPPNGYRSVMWPSITRGCDCRCITKKRNEGRNGAPLGFNTGKATTGYLQKA